MKRIFGQDSALFKFLQILMSLAVMNVLFLLTSIPIITMGAAYTALLSCVFDLLMDEGEFSAKYFLIKFRKIWKPASVIGTTGFIILAMLGHHTVLFLTTESSVGLIAAGFYIALFIWIFGMMICQFSVLARKNHWEKVMLKDGAILALAKFPVFIMILIVTVSPLTFLMMSASSLISMLPVAVLFWIACPAMVSGWMIRRVLEKIYPELFKKTDKES